MVFRGNGGVIGRRTAERKGGGGGLWKVEGGISICYGASRRENDSMILQTLVNIWKTEMFFFGCKAL